MDAIQVEDAVVGEQRTLAPRFILFGQGLIKTTHGACARGGSHQFFSDFSHFMGTRATVKHFSQRFSYLGFIPTIALKHLCMELPLTISGHREVLNAPCLGHQVSCVIAVAIPFSLRSAFPPLCTQAL